MTRRGITASEAAEICGLTISGFQSWVRRGIMPPALPGTNRYDRVAIERRFDELSGEKTTPTNAYDAWKAKRNVCEA